MAIGSEELLLPTREIVKVEHFPHQRMTNELVDQWGEGIPSFDKSDPNRPEWQETPLKEIDLTRYGAGMVSIKDESVNPTGTIKDRPAWDLTGLYRDYARAIWLTMRRDGKTHAEDFVVPSFSLITSGNEARAIADRFRQHNLPPPKFIVDPDISKAILDELKRLKASVYKVSLKDRPLSTEEILALTDNKDGVDITSVQFIEPQAIFYDWHVHEVLNQRPDYVFVPSGSNRLMENYLYWQAKNTKGALSQKPDPRLRVYPSEIIGVSVLGARPIEPNSIADKLNARFHPFLIFEDQDIRGLKNFALTGRETDVYQVEEDYLKQAHGIMINYGINAEPSAAAGLALYLRRWEQKLIDPRKKVIVVNTGEGLYEDDSIEAAA